MARPRRCNPRVRVLPAAGWTVFAGTRAVVVADAGRPFFLAVMFAQTAFIGHDAGHRQIFGCKRTDGLIGRRHGDLLMGLSYGWWIARHNRRRGPPRPGRSRP